jgi:UDP-glucose 4-epimerase
VTKVLVTGGAGFIGSHVVDALANAGHRVVVIDNMAHGRAENLNPAARFYRVDICDERAVEEVFAAEQPEILCHHAALISVRDALARPLEYARVNIVGSLGLLEAARRHALRKVIFASSGGAVYGEGRDHGPFQEGWPPRPLDPYGASKLCLEHYLDVYRANFGLDHVCLRYANVYGPRQDPFGEGGVVAIFAQRMIAGRPCTIHGDGSKVRDFVYVGDVARANLLACSTGSGTCNIGSGEPATILSVYAGLARAVPGYDLAPLHDADLPGEVWVSHMRNDEARRMLGWAPATSLAAGLALTADYFRLAH